MKNNLFTTDIIFAAIFAIVATTSLIGVIFFGAWWHLLTFVIASILAIVLYTEAIEEKESSDKI